MKKKDILRKITSRKFLVGLAGLVTGIIVMCNAGPEIAEKIGGFIITGGSLLGYLVGETITDVARAKKKDEENKDENNE